jgi:hypothetical protein
MDEFTILFGISGAGHGNNQHTSCRTSEELKYLGQVMRITGIPGAGHENN